MRSELTVLGDDTRWRIDVRDLRCSGIRRFVMTHSNVIYSTFHLLPRRREIRRCGWWVCFPHCPIAQITLSSVKLHRLIAVLLYWLRLPCNTERTLCCRKVFVDSNCFFSSCCFELFWILITGSLQGFGARFVVHCRYILIRWALFEPTESQPLIYSVQKDTSSAMWEAQFC